MLEAKRKGLTLTGLLVTCAIIAVVMALIAAAVGSARARTNEVACASNLRQLGAALELFLQDHDAYPPDFPEGAWVETVLPYTKGMKLLNCPEDENVVNWSSYEPYYVHRGESDRRSYLARIAQVLVKEGIGASETPHLPGTLGAGASSLRAGARGQHVRADAGPIPGGSRRASGGETTMATTARHGG